MTRSENFLRHPASKMLSAFLTIALGLTSASSALAADSTEPFNNIPVGGPTGVTNVHGLHSRDLGSGEYQQFYAIDSSTDKDYILLVCNSLDPYGPTRYVEKVWITFSHGAGDLDMELLDSGQPYTRWGYSYGVTDQEQVWLPVSTGSVTLYVFGYQGATGTFTVGYSCV